MPFLCEVVKNDRETIIFTTTEIKGVSFLNCHVFGRDSAGKLIPTGNDSTLILNMLPMTINIFKEQIKDRQEMVAVLDKVMVILRERELCPSEERPLLKEFTKSAGILSQ